MWKNMLKNTYHEFLVTEPGDETFGNPGDEQAEWDAEDEVPEY